MKENRLRKIEDFEHFYDNCDSLFTKLRDNDNRVEVFQNEYMLCICPGSRAGGNEKRIVEIFWGARPYEFVSKGKQWKSYTESGATIFFYRNDTGDVTISLYPAKTEFRQPIESQILLYVLLDPKNLNRSKFIRSLWNVFIAYMECTSLDGKPTFSQRLKVSYLRNFKHMVIDTKWRPTRFSVFIKEVLKLILAACFSGAVLIYVLNLLYKPTTKETDNLFKELNRNLEIISKKLDKTTEDNLDAKTLSLDTIFNQLSKLSESLKKINSVTIATDSIVVKTKELLKSNEQYKQINKRK